MAGASSGGNDPTTTTSSGGTTVETDVGDGNAINTAPVTSGNRKPFSTDLVVLVLVIEDMASMCVAYDL